MSVKACRNVLIAVLMTAGCIGTAPAQFLGGDSYDVRSVEPATLVLWNRPIVTFRAVVGGNDPAQRVRNARRRIAAVSHEELGRPVTLQAARLGALEGIILSIGSVPAFGVVPADVDPESGLTLQQFAERAAGQLHDALLAREAQRRLPVLVRGIGLSLLATLIFVALLRLTILARNHAVRIIDSWVRRRQPLALAGIDIAPTLATVERATFRVLSWAIVIVSSYLWITFVLHQFPYTAPLGRRLGASLAEQLGDAGRAIVAAAPRLAMVVGVLLITRSIALWVARILAEVEQGVRVVKWLAQEQARATRRIATTVIWMLGAVIAYPLLPWARSALFQGMSVVLGLGVSLASAGLVSQWISGLVILYSRSFKVGDFVIIGEVEGFVTEMGSLATKLRTVRREEITLPNAVLTSDRLTNLTRLGAESGSLLSTSLAIGYDVPWAQVRALLLRAANETEGVRRDPPARVLQWKLQDFSVEYHLHVFLERAEERAAVMSALHARILDAFAAARVQIMTPHFESQPSKPVIPPESATPPR
ncbi:MAG: mechanosensitive ion channel protein [Proteobacteria bacterium]|nr:MAG: mechanosensitive ion channel protein [Pseudomonadota bacterium]